MFPTSGKMAHKDEEDLIDQARRGSSSSFGELAGRHRNRLRRYLVGRGARLHDAEDMVQETFLRAMVHIRTYQTGRSFEAWLIGIASNLLAEHHRRKRPLPLDGREAGLLAEANSPDENLWPLARTLLPQKQFAALYLRYSQGCTIRETAGIMGLSSIHVKVLLYRARRRLLTSAQFRAHVSDEDQARKSGGVI